jgi:hypothetical protein
VDEVRRTPAKLVAPAEIPPPRIPPIRRTPLHSPPWLRLDAWCPRRGSGWQGRFLGSIYLWLGKHQGGVVAESNPRFPADLAATTEQGDGSGVILARDLLLVC